jgi:prephenate dehydrogenase
VPGWNSVAIFGVGLIGGSIGLALRQRSLCPSVVGIGRDMRRLEAALERGAITRATTDVGQAVGDADVVVVCTPVRRVANHVLLVAAASRPDTLITDVGSTKLRIVAEIESCLPADRLFVGSHPLAGSDKSGVEFASSRLFQDRTVVITPTDRSGPEAVRRITEFWSALDAVPVTMPPESHDRALAQTSHLPHIVAAALAAGTPPEFLHLVASGWLDTTRVAAADGDLWTQILLENRENMLAAIRGYEGQLTGFARALESGDAEALQQLLNAGKQRRDAVGS